MFDFPNTPITGDTATAPNGTVFRWDGVKWIGAGSTQAVASPYGNVGRNLVHNGLFNVAQRGNGPWTMAYTVDRWVASFNLDASSVSRTAIPDAGRAQIGDEAAVWAITVTIAGNAGATSSTVFEQRLEGTRRFGGKTVVVSFWAVGTAALKVGAQVWQSFGTGGSPSAPVAGPASAVTIATTWARYSVTLAVPSTAGKTLGTNGDDITALDLWLSGGSNNTGQSGGVSVQSGTISLWGVQLEVGNIATPLEKRTPQEELAECQRFYQTGVVSLYAYNNAGTYVTQMLPFPVTMRATPSGTPTLTPVNMSGLYIDTSASHVRVVGTATATGPCNVIGTFTVSADL